MFKRTELIAPSSLYNSLTEIKYMGGRKFPFPAAHIYLLFYSTVTQEPT